MPDNFEFKSNDPYVVQNLTPQEIGTVTVWQSDDLDYEFSFHTQHEGGWPCYLKEPNGPNRNLPKINLKVPTTPISLLQGESVRQITVGQDFKAVITANLALFQKLARLYYEGVEVQQVRRPAWVVSFQCKTDKHAKAVQVKLPESAQGLGTMFWLNFRRFATVPKCPLHRVSTCLEPSVVQLKHEDAAKVKKRYDLNGEIEDDL